MKLEENIVISGASIINPIGSGIQDFRKGTNEGRSAIRALHSMGRSGESIRCGSAVTGYVPTVGNKKVLNQTDRSTQMAITVMNEALNTAAVDARVPADRVGVFIGSSFGGIEFSEGELYNQIYLGPRKVSAYQAIAWFYAATQGQFTIDRQIRGFAKSYVGGANGGIHALLMSIVSLLNGHCDVAVVCASEATITPFYLGILERTGVYSAVVDPAVAYRPFTGENTGQIPAEGAVALVIERREDAAARGVPGMARILGFGNHAAQSTGELFGSVYQAQAAVIEESNYDGGTVIFPHASARSSEDLIESHAAESNFCEGTFWYALPKTLVGSCLSAAGLTDVVWALLYLQGAVRFTQTAPAYLHQSRMAQGDEADTAVVVAKDFYNICAALTLGKI